MITLTLKNCWDVKELLLCELRLSGRGQGEGEWLTMKWHMGTGMSDEMILDLEYSGDYITACGCQNVQNYALKRMNVNYVFIKMGKLV